MDSMALTNEVAMSCPSLCYCIPMTHPLPGASCGCPLLHRLPTCRSQLDPGVGPDEFSLLSAWFLLYF